MKLKTYVEAREANFRKGKSFLSKGVKSMKHFWRWDGEAILQKERRRWHFLCHLDPLFVEIEDVEGFVENIEEIGRKRLNRKERKNKVE